MPYVLTVEKYVLGQWKVIYKQTLDSQDIFNPVHGLILVLDGTMQAGRSIRVTLSPKLV